MRSRSVLLHLALTVAGGLCLARPAAAQLPPFEVLYEFPEGVYPGPLIEASDGNFYGTTSAGGAYNRGTIFRMTRDYRVSTVYEFSGAFDGGYPTGKLLQASDGHLYGATYRNGAYDQGILYRITLDGEFRILHAFNLALDSRYPTGSLMQGADGFLYGTTDGAPYDQAHDYGAVFRSTLDGDVAVLHAFVGGMNDGGSPGPLIQASDGNFYGKTAMGGYYDRGTLFRMTPAGVVTIIHRFTESMPSDSGNTTSRTLVQAADGNIYGHYGCLSSIFRITLQGIFTGISSLSGSTCGTAQGPTPVELMAGDAGLLYAAASGATYVVDLAGQSSLIQPSSVRGESYLLQSINGHLYGTEYQFHPRVGRIVRITPHAGQVTKPGAVSVGTAGVRVSWAPVGNATSYTVERREPGGAFTVVASGLQALSSTDATAVRGVRYTYIVSATNSFGDGLASREVSILAGRATAGDFDGDGASDPAIFRPSTGEWHIRGAPTVVTWGGVGDVPVAADYDGDGIVDIAVFRPSTGRWYIRGVGSVAWGGSGDIPVPGYYLGRNAVDLAVYRPSIGTWFIRGLGAIAWGVPSDVPDPADYDGDGRTDTAICRSSPQFSVTDGWYIRYATGVSGHIFRCCGSEPVSGDYDGDGRIDPADFRRASGDWHVTLSTGGDSYSQWGGTSDTLVPGDYNGDGLTDVATFRETTGEWFVLLSAPPTNPRTGIRFQWGGPGDIPIQKRP